MKTRHSVKKTKCGRIRLWSCMDNRHCSLPQLRLQARGTSPIGGPNKGAERKQPHPVKQPFYHESIEALEAAAEAFVRDSQFCEHLLKSSMDRWPQDPRVGVALAEAQLFIPKIMLYSVALWSSRLIGAFDDRRFNGLPMHFRPWQCSGMLVPQPPWQSSGMLVPQPMRILGIVDDSVAT